MELIKLRGHTYYIPGPTNVGVYLYKNGMCALIDTGLDNSYGNKIVELLETKGVKVKYIINTHSHPDHFGANNSIRDLHTGAQVYASKLESIFMENSYLESIFLYGANPIKELHTRTLKAKDTKVDFILEPGSVGLGDKNFEIISLPGHSIDQIGVVTPDDVAFIGDSVFSEEILAKYSFPFLTNIEASYKTLDFLSETNYSLYVPSHSEKLFEDIKAIITANKMNIDNYCSEFLDLLTQPTSHEDLTQMLIQLHDLEMNYSQYFITHTTVGAFLSYLTNQDKLQKDLLDGKIYYFQG